MSNLTDDQRLQIVTLHTDTCKTVKQIAEDIKLSQSAVERVLLNYRKTGDHHSSKTNCGRLRITTAAEDRLLIRKSKKDAKASSADSRWNVTHRGIYDIKNRQKSANPEQCNETKKRLQCAHKHKDRTLEMWSSVSFIWLLMIRWVTPLTDRFQVMFSDETMIELQPPLSQFVRRSWIEPISEVHLNQKTKHTLKLMFWGCKSSQGMGRLHFFRLKKFFDGQEITVL